MVQVGYDVALTRRKSGFKSPWAHIILVTEIAPSTRKYMRIELDATEDDAYTILQNQSEVLRPDAVTSKT